MNLYERLEQAVEQVILFNPSDCGARAIRRFAQPKLRPGETPFPYIARKLAEEESNTPRLLKGLEAAWRRMASETSEPLFRVP